MVLIMPVSINLALHQVRDRSRANVVTPPSNVVTPPFSGFSDVDQNSWSWKYILPIVNLGIMPPKTPTLFDPLGLVPRSDMAQFLLKTYELVTNKQAETVPTPFTDIKDLSPETQDAIAKIYGLKVTAGTSATTFSPDQSVNRAQMVTFFMNLYRAINGDYPPETDVPFTDIYDPDLEWSVKYIKKAYNLKITAGTSATTFSPRDNVTREQMATFIYNFMRVFPSPTSDPSPSPIESPVTKKVMVINFNPIIESQNNKKLTEVYNWNNPQTLSNQYIADIKQASGNYVNYQIAEWHDADDFPVKQNGFDFTDDSFLQCMQNHSCDGTMTNYQKILADFQVCEKRNTGTIDELWLWGGPWFGYWEAVMAGPNAFWTNGPTVTNSSCQKQLHIMGFNYERGVPEMLEDLGHRAEGVMKYVFGSWEANPTHAWNRFTLYDKIAPQKAACGNIHYAPNSQSDYDWSNQTTVSSSCEDWLNYPNLTGVTQNFNCSPWNCNGYDYKKWWLNHLPRVSGQTDGKWNNWWRYFLDYEEAVNPVASLTPIPPPSPSMSPLPSTKPVPSLPPQPSPSLLPSSKPSPEPPLPPENNSPLIITNKLGYARINRQYSRLIIGIDFDKNDSLFMSATDLPQGINLTSCREINTFWAKYSLCYLRGETSQSGTFPVTITLQDSQGVWDQKRLPLIVRK
jgi:hypothetical protein